MANIILDPTREEFSGNTDYQNLFIFVDLTANRKGNSVVVDNGSTTTEPTVVNLMGFNQDKKKSADIFTSDYSKIYIDDTVYEGFGIKKINIETNSSYVPKINIEFVDIKGMSFFNNADSSPYSIIFDFPPPIFNLKIKGYYGKTLEYKLHLIRHNTRFDSDTGNFYINAEFVGNTFAPLTDILFQNVLMVSKLEDTDVNVDPKRGVNSLADLVAKSKIIINEVLDKVQNSEELKRLTDINNELKKYNDSFNDSIELNENTLLIKVDKNLLSTRDNPKYIKDKNFRLNQLTNTNKFEYYLIEKELNTVFNRGTEIRFIFDKIFSPFGLILNNLQENQTAITVPPFNPININDFGESSSFTLLNITKYINKANIEKNDLSKRNDNLLKNIEDKTRDIVKNELGFEPTVKKVIEIIADDIDKWVSKLSEVYDKSKTFILQPGNSNKILGFYGNSNSIEKIYPFPDFIESDKKSLPSSNELPMEEILFTDNFIRRFIDYKNEVARSNELQIAEIIDDNNKNVWFPINPKDSSYYSIYTPFPYQNITQPNEILNELFARIYIYTYYTNSFLINQDSSNNKNFSYIFKNEDDVILGLIKEPKLLNSLKEILINITNRTIKDEVIKYIDFNLISSRVNKILNGIDINTTDFSGIEFTEKEITLSTDITQNLFYNNYYKSYNIKLLESDEFGFTINNTNNIVYYDGGGNSKSSFTSFNQNDYEDIDDIIIKSLNYGLLGNNRGNKINITPDINDRIYDYYINYNNPDIYKKAFGILNMIYIPNETIKILFETSNIVQLPRLVKLYISSLVYGIETSGILEVDINYFIDNNNNYIDLINQSNNKDFIYILYKNNVGGVSGKEKISENREYLINKLKNLSKSDKDKYIDYYKDNINTYFNNLDLFIKSLLNNDGKFRNEYNIEDINTSNISVFFEKTVIINNSLYTYQNKETFENLFSGNLIQTNLTNLLENKTFIGGESNSLITGIGSNLSNRFSGISGLFKNLITNINRISENKTNENEEPSLENVRIETYYSFKNFVDRWFTTDENENVSNRNLFYTRDTTNTITEFKLKNLFSFIDRSSNNIGDNVIIDFTILQEFENDYNVNMLTVIGKLLNENGFEFFPLQNFINFNDGNQSSWNIDSVFTPLTSDVNITKFGPRFTCMYIGGTSKYLDSYNNANTTFKNDGIINIDDAKDFGESKDSYGFRVKFGDGKQSLFKKIELNTEEFQPTNESLKAMSLILDNNDKQPVPIAQNLFSTYEQRSYTCKVTMLGNAMIQPTQFFMLENIPMFRGLYLILKVNHIIDGETNTMYTEFEGIRLPKEPRPFISKPFDVYVKNYLKTDLISTDLLPEGVGQENIDETINLNKEKRTIHLISGHDNGENRGANGLGGIIEHDLTKEFKGLLKTELNALSIDNTVDNDNDTLNDVIRKLNEIVDPDDIVIDIHFNAFRDSTANGTEVLIKDTRDGDVIEIADRVVKTISQTLNTTLRKGVNTLPLGVKLQYESQYNSLAIFGINAKVILVEICFITNQFDLNSYQRNKNELARKIARLFSEVTISENDKELGSVTTFSVLNELRYDNILNRQNPYDITSNDLSLFNQLIETNNFTFTANGSGTSFKSKFTNGKKYTATQLKSYYQNYDNYKNDIRNQLNLTSNKHKIDWLVLAGLIYIESKFNPVAISQTGAFGIGQFILSSGLLEILKILNNSKGVKSDVIVYDSNTNSYVQKNISRMEVLDILFDNNKVDINDLNSSNVTSRLKDLKLLDILINSTFNNPFLCIELIAIYINKLETYVGTIENKNLGIISLSYNTGNNKNNRSNNRIYFDHIINWYNNTTSEIIKQKLIGKARNEGIKYPERLLNEYIGKFISIDQTQSILF